MLSGKTILITGANRGIGRAIAERCASHGGRLLLHSRNIESLIPIVDELQRQGHDPTCISGDLAESGSGKKIIQQAMRIGSLDGLIANAGMLITGPVGMLRNEDLSRLFQVNLFSVIELIQYGSRLMQRGGGGSIVTLSSIMGIRGEANMAAYAASKAALIGLTRSLAKELAPVGIRVNGVAPGLIDTDMAESADDEVLSARIDRIAMGRIGKPEEVAETVAYLASDRASYVSGQILGVDGVMTV